MSKKQKLGQMFTLLIGVFLLGLCGCENPPETPSETAQSSHSPVDHSHSQDDDVPPEPQPTPEVIRQDEDTCLITEANIDTNNPRVDTNYRFLLKADTHVVFPAGVCTKYIYYSDGSKKLREQGYDYLAVMPRIDLHEARMNGDVLEVKFRKLTSDDIVVDERELEEVFGTSVYKFDTLKPGRLAQKGGTTREGYKVYFFNKNVPWEEFLEDKDLFYSFPQTFDAASNVLLMDVSKDRAFFDKCFQAGSLTVKVYATWDIQPNWAEHFVFRHPLVLKDK